MYSYFTFFRAKNLNDNNESNLSGYLYKIKRLKDIISFEDPVLTLKAFLYSIILMKVFKLIGDRVFILVILNIFIFYAPIEKKFPHFLFKSRMYFKQSIEGTFGILECFIPRYKEEKEKTK